MLTSCVFVLELEDFVNTIKEKHGTEYAAPLVSSLGDSALEASPSSAELLPHSQPASKLSPRSDTETVGSHAGRISETCLSPSNPPILPDFDFPWRRERSLTFELIDDIDHQDKILR
jgi:hypothetical protein